jgi:lysophospholipase L1-like esterase
MTTRAAILAMTLVVSLAAAASAPPKQLHVAVVGDSLAFGEGDEAGKGIAGRIEPELRSRGVGTVLTTNLGVTGATTHDVVSRLKQPAARTALARADAIVLSVGANDIRYPLDSENRVRSPLLIIDQALRNLDAIVAEMHRINPEARIFILGAYAPLAHERAATLLEPLVAIWDTMLATRYASNPRVAVVRLSDIVNRPDRLSTIDSFHPGGEAYQETARRIADLLAARPS